MFLLCLLLAKTPIATVVMLLTSKSIGKVVYFAIAFWQSPNADYIVASKKETDTKLTVLNCDGCRAITIIIISSSSSSSNSISG